MAKRKTIAILMLLIVISQLFMPIVNQSYATAEESETIENTEEPIDENNDITETQENNDNSINEIEENSTETINGTSNEEDNTNSEIDTLLQNTDENNDITPNETDNTEPTENDEEIEPILDIQMMDLPLVGTASGSGSNAGNESQFSSLFYNTGVSELTIQSNIRLNGTYNVNHNFRIDASSQAGANALQLSSGSKIVVTSGYVLTLDEVVIDGRTFGNNDDKACISVQNGATLMLTGHSIVDGGTANWGISVEAGGQLLVESGQVCNCKNGVVLHGNSYCDLGSNTVAQRWGNTGKTVDIINNEYGVYCGANYRGTLIVNHVSNNSDKINFENNRWGIMIEEHSGNITVKNARMFNNYCAIYTYGNLTIDGIDAGFNIRGLAVDNNAIVSINSGRFYADNSNKMNYGIQNKKGTVNMNGCSIYNANSGVYNKGTVNMPTGTIGNSTRGVENYGTFNFTGGTITSGSYGIDNQGTVNMSNGTITDFSWGAKNIGTFNLTGGSITGNSTYGIVNEASDSITGQVYMTGGNVTGNTSYDIYHAKSDTDAGGAVYGGLRIERNDNVSSSIYLAAYNNYIYTGSSTPTLSSITLGDVHIERNVIRTSNNSNATTMNNKITVKNKDNYYTKPNATGHSNYVVLWADYTITTYHKTEAGEILDTETKTYEYKQNYTTSPKTIDGYILLQTPSNANGQTTGDISVVYIYKDDRNVAIVNYKDLVSGVVSAKYWYNSSSNSFSGNGTSFSDGTVFENYGYYKVVVTNGVGLQKELTFELNKDSV